MTEKRIEVRGSRVCAKPELLIRARRFQVRDPFRLEEAQPGPAHSLAPDRQQAIPWELLLPDRLHPAASAAQVTQGIGHDNDVDPWPDSICLGQSLPELLMGSHGFSC